MNQYNAVLCGIARDEDRYIVEWVAYHLSIGFDHIYLYDNMSLRPIDRIVSRRVRTAKVTVIRWPSIPGEDAQLSAYRHFLHTYGRSTIWGAVLDLDEFLNLKRDRTVAAFLARFPTATTVAVNWRMFGSSGETEYSKNPLGERFTKASEMSFEANGLVKSIYRLERVKVIHHHTAEYIDNSEIRSAAGRMGRPDPFSPGTQDDFEVAQVNHYFVKSTEEWEKKNIRGYADQTKRSAKDFLHYDQNAVVDATIVPRLRAARAMMRFVAAETKFVPYRLPTLDWMVYKLKALIFR